MPAWPMSKTVRRAPVHVCSEDGRQAARLVILMDGRVRLRIQIGEVVHDLYASTLEQIGLLAAVEPLLSPVLYHQLIWELDLKALAEWPMKLVLAPSTSCMGRARKCGPRSGDPQITPVAGSRRIRRRQARLRMDRGCLHSPGGQEEKCHVGRFKVIP